MPASILVHEKDDLASDYRDKQCKAEIVVIEEDWNIRLSSIQTKFPLATGLRFKQKVAQWNPYEQPKIVHCIHPEGQETGQGMAKTFRLFLLHPMR